MSSFVCSHATIQCSYQQSDCDDWPIHRGLACCPFFTVEFTRSEATDRPRSSCMVRGFESVSRYHHSSFHWVRCLFLDIRLIYLFWFSELDEAVSISTLRTSQVWWTYSPLGYWRSLWSSLDFADQPLKSCVNIIHVDIVEIWNLFDRHKVNSPQLPTV